MQNMKFRVGFLLGCVGVGVGVGVCGVCGCVGVGVCGVCVGGWVWVCVCVISE